LDCEGRRAKDEDAVNGLAELHLLNEETGHDGFAGAGVVGEQEAQARLRQLMGTSVLWGHGERRARVSGVFERHMSP
jgi:hypothetical protein